MSANPWIVTENFFPLTTESGEILVTDQFITVPPLPLRDIIPAYLYLQYADDDDLQAFIAAYNTLAQPYLDWFNQTPLGVYVNASVTGALLDWIGQGIYGVPRPVFSTISDRRRFANVNAAALNTVGINSSSFVGSGTAILADDDYYKRTLTWYNFLGNGRMTNLMLIRWKIARWLFGVNGADVTIDLAQRVHISIHTGPLYYAITIPAGQSSTYFKQAFEAGLLPFPFQLVAQIAIV